MCRKLLNIPPVVGSAEMHVEVGPWVDVAPRDTLLVASDGLSDNLTNEEIVERIRKGPIDTALDQLTGVARERMLGADRDQPSKPDDLSLILFRKPLLSMKIYCVTDIYVGPYGFII